MKLLLAFLALSACAEDHLPEAPGKALFMKICGDCHGPEVVTGMGHDRPGWKDVVDEMVDKGATASAKEREEIIDYLVKAFPKKRAVALHLRK